MSRWISSEANGIEQMRIRLRKEMEPFSSYPDLVGDRKLIRFFRGAEHDLELAIKLYGDFLKWRTENNLHEIRQRILYGGINNPYLFPNGEKIINLVPQNVIAPNARDIYDRPLVFEAFGFDPEVVMSRCTLEEYIAFLIYTLEFRALILEELSEYKEREIVKTAAEKNEPLPDGYGVILKTCVIRDFEGGY
jgi:hypothetical protein